MLPGLERVVVVGPSGSGKSTLGLRLAETLGSPHVEMDALHWEPGWVEAPDAVVLERLLRATAGPRWVVSGNYLNLTQEHLWPRAQTILWLDLPLGVVLYRVIARTLRRAWTRELLWGTNRERFLPMFALWDPEKSMIAWTLSSHARRRRQLEAASQDPRWAAQRFVRLRTAAEVAAWEERLRR